MSAAPDVRPVFDVFPLDVASGPEFIVIFSVLAVVALALAKALQLAFVRSRDAAADAERGDDRAPARLPLREGVLPHASQHLSLAFLRGGRDAAADTLVAHALARGWLDTRPDEVRAARPPGDAPAEERELAAELGTGSRTPDKVLRAARAVIERRAERLEEELIEDGLLRPASTAALGRAVAVAAVAPLLLLGGLRLWAGVAAGRPVGFLALEMIAVLVALVWVSAVHRRTGRGDALLSWLDDASAALVVDVQNGRRRELSDVGFVSAIGHHGLLPAIALVPALFAADAARPAGGDGGSGCGGGCGGGGCGG